MAITNTDKPVVSNLTNTTKLSSGETWGHITTSWASETRSWLDCVSFMTNTTKVSSSITNTNKPI